MWYNSKNYTTLKPWYGTWPPKIKTEGRSMKKRAWGARERLTLSMFAVFLCGIILLLASYNAEVQRLTDWQLFHDVGIGIIIAGLLGVSIDQVLRRQLAEDAFRASIGYLLPEELRSEMEWIYSSHVLCIDHNQSCELRPIDDKVCTFYVKTVRKFRNISSSNETLSLGVAIDEWFHDTGSSKILSFGYTKLDTKSEDFELAKSTHSIAIKEQKVSLAPMEEITVWFETEEIKHRNDDALWNFGAPTLNPTITVKAFEGISIVAGFGYRSPPEELGAGTYRLKGTLLPSQIVIIRWWEKEKGEKYEKG